MKPKVNTVLIAGTSHVGKSTFAVRLSQACNWPVLSTDSLARHPGRPWQDPPEHVIEFYDTLSDDTIYRFLRDHHQNMVPMIVARLATEKANARPLILEGAALRPETFEGEMDGSVIGVCLYASPEYLMRRMHVSSYYDRRDAKTRRIIDRFVTRSVTDNSALFEAAQNAGFTCVDSADENAVVACQAKILTQIELLAPD